MDLFISTNTATRYITIVGTGILLALFLSSTHIARTEARSMSPEDDFFAEPIVKRNTWWTKKSLNAMDTIPHSNYESRYSGYDKCQDTIDVYSCYVSKCVQSFVQCSRQARSEELYGACKVLHKLCASTCSKNIPDDWLQL